MNSGKPEPDSELLELYFRQKTKYIPSNFSNNNQSEVPSNSNGNHNNYDFSDSYYKVSYEI